MPKYMDALARLTGTPILKVHRIKGEKYKETFEQTMLFFALDQVARDYPILSQVYHPANEGGGGTAGKIRQGQLQRQGLRPGLWDVCYDGASSISGIGNDRPNTLRVELKVGYNDLSEKQYRWGIRHHRNCYSLAVAYTWEDAWFFIRQHFGLPIFETWDTPEEQAVLRYQQKGDWFWSVDPKDEEDI